MSNYQQTTVAGEAWTRASRVVIDNPLIEVPTINFVEQRVVALGNGQTIEQPAGNIVEHFHPLNQDTEFSLRHPETGDVIGTATYAQVHVLLHSLYYALAERRDNANAAIEVE